MAFASYVWAPAWTAIRCGDHQSVHYGHHPGRHHFRKARFSITPLRMRQQPGPPQSSPSSTEPVLSTSSAIRRLTAGGIWCIYLPYIFFLAPPAPGDPQFALSEALQLSFNFSFISPLLLPSFAPILHPLFECLFNFVVAWALLLFGFTSESLSGKQRLPYVPFAIAIAFLTNIFYLPYLAFRSDNPYRIQQPVRKPSAWLVIGESKALPVFCVALTIACIAWGALAHPAEYGGIAKRVSSFKTILQNDILAHSLMVDALAFPLFQSFLIDDDVRRREWTGPEMKHAVNIARFVPFFGLAFYLWRRSQCASLLGVKERNGDELEGKKTK